ncbi:MAG: O-antigen ligase family protein, partial [bacterium]
VGLLFYGLLSSRRFRIYFAIPAFGMIVWGLLASFGAPFPDLALHELSRLVRAYLAFLCVINFTRSRKDIYTVLVSLLVGLAFQGIIGYFQWHHGSLGLTFLGESYFSFRARGLFMHPSFFGNYLVLLIPVAFRLFAFYKPPRKYHTVIYGLLFSIGMAALYGSYSRGPWLAFAGAIVIMFLFTLFQRRFYPKIVSAVAFLVLMGTIFVIHYTPVIIAQFTDEYRKGSTEVRVPLDIVALRVIKGNWAFGTGIGNYEYTTQNYITPNDPLVTEDTTYEDLLQQVHNTYLIVAAEIGVPGFLFFIWFLFSLFKAGWRTTRIKNSLIANIGLGLLTGLLAILVAFLASPDYREHQILMIFWIVSGYLVALSAVKVAPKKAVIKREAEPRASAYQPMPLRRNAF